MVTRRRFVYGMASIPLAMHARSWALTSPNTGNNPTWAENANVGTLNWQMGLSGFSRADDVDLQIKGYASATSINKGESIQFFITVNPVPQTYSIDVYRVGWYSGNGGQLKLHVSGLNGVAQPAPKYDAATGLVVCPWSASYTLDTSQPTLDSTGWTSGIYLALLTNANKYQTYIIFVIRDDSRIADLMFQQSVTTYQAYNNYPDDNKLGKSLYDGGSYGSHTSLGTQRAVKVSFDRPYTYTDHTGAGELLHYDIYFLRWLERNGYDVCYSTNIDTHVSGSRLLNFKALLCVGHDEYWSRQMYDNAYAARDAGTSLGFFVANPLYWQIRLEPSTLNGVGNRVIACYKDASLDPYNSPSSPLYNPQLTTVTWRDALLNRPEQQLVGVMYSTYMNADNPADAYVVINSQSALGQLVYAGTGLNDGNSIPGVLGYEFDKQFTNFNTPVTNTDPASKSTVVASSYTLLGRSPFTDAYNNKDFANSCIYQVSSGAWVFGAGSMYWNWGLDNYMAPFSDYAVAAPSSALQIATANILNLFLSGGSANTLAAPSVTGSYASNAIQLAWTAVSQATGYSVWRSSDGVNWGNNPVATGSTTTYSDSTPGTWYFRVQAFSSSATSPFSNVVCVIASLSASPSSSTLAVSLSWLRAATATSYEVDRSTDSITWTIIASALAAGTQSTQTYTDSSLAPGVGYFYRVRPTLSNGSTSFSNIAAATSPSAPTPASNLTATVSGKATRQSIVLQWIDNDTHTGTTYSVQRSKDASTWSSIATNLSAGSTTFTDSNVSRRTTYYYRIAANNSALSAFPSYSNVASARTA